MDVSDPFRAAQEIPKSDVFDLVVGDMVTTAQGGLPHFNRSLKSLGIYVESSPETNNNNSAVGSAGVQGDTNNNHTAVADKERLNNNNNNNTMACVGAGAGGVQYVDTGGGESYWGTTATGTKEEMRWDHSVLEDLECWNQEGKCDTDGAIYTLTVLNGTDPTTTWYRVPDPDRSSSIDLDSLLNNILPDPVQQQPFADLQPTSSKQFAGYHDTTTTTTTTATGTESGSSYVATTNNPNSDAASCNSDSNNSGKEDWSKSPCRTEARVNSLLRNALQGKPFASRYNGAVKKTGEKEEVEADRVLPVRAFEEGVATEGGAVIVFEGGAASQQPTGMDDIFLSQLDSVGYGDDYEKLKSIEHEVAKSVEQFCGGGGGGGGGDHPYFGVAVSSQHPTTVHAHAHTVTGAGQKNAAKKYCKRSSKSEDHGTVGGASGAVRKERSLHYCTVCHKGFKDKYSVNVHVRTHTGEKPFACTFCGKNFRQKAHLAKHHHTHSVQKTASTASTDRPHNNKHR